MPSTDSDEAQKVAGMLRIRWSPSTGLGARHVPDSVAAFRRITQLGNQVIREEGLWGSEEGEREKGS